MTSQSNTETVTTAVESQSQPLTNSPIYYGAVRVDENEGTWESGQGDSWNKVPKVEVADGNNPEPVYNDLLFSVLFIMHLGAMLFLGISYGSWTVGGDGSENGGKDEDQQSITESTEIYLTRIALYLAAPCSAVSFILTFAVTSFVIPKCANFVVGSSLVLSLASTLCIAMALCVQYPAWYTLLGSFVLCAASAYYVMIVWKLIPFAATNLVVSIKGISSNWGTYLVALVFSVIAFLWWFAWFFVANGVLNSETSNVMVNSCEEDDPDCPTQTSGEGDGGILWGTLFLLLVSLYWTCTVMMNTVQVTVAGVMGTWCFDKDGASTCCSSAVTSSLLRSVTYSFGSICFGSLLNAIITALRVLASYARDQARNNDNNCSGEGMILLCIIECILRLIEDIIEYFNRWAYVFVGIYGYGYIESGKKVIELFQARGWTSIITYDLAGYTLNFTAILVGLCSGLVGIFIVAIETKMQVLFGDLGGQRYWGFSIGFIFGVFIASVMTNVIAGAVNTLIVCFADAPARLEENHPDLTKQMVESWVSVFPDCGVRLQNEPAASAIVV